MKQMTWLMAPLMAATTAVTFASPSAAQTTVACDTLAAPTYITGSSAVKPFLAALGAELSKGATPTTIVYLSKGSCVGVAAGMDPAGNALTGTATYWLPGATATDPPAAKSCTLAAGTQAHVGISDVFPTTCAGVTSVLATVGDFYGPNQVMNFVVPAASSQTSISADAAYLVFGFGQAAAVAPWIDDAFVFVRGATSGTQSMLATAIGAPPAKWFANSIAAQVMSGADVMAAKVAGSAKPEATLGILASTDVDPLRSTIKILAYQHQVPGKLNQTCAYLPDSTATAFDKINVRDGHYPIWGPLHFITPIDATTKLPTKPQAKVFIDYFTVAPPAGVALLDVEIATHTVPACAMKVQRTTELGDVSAYSPVNACGCYFEFKATGSAPAGCKSCTADSECPTTAPKCNDFGDAAHKYCEAK